MESFNLQLSLPKASAHFVMTTVLNVFTKMVEHPWSPMIDFNKVTSGIKRFGLIDDGQFDHILLKYATFKGPYKDKLCLYLQDILPIVSVTDFALILSDAGYSDICDSILSIGNTNLGVVKKRQLPRAEIVHEFYITLKMLADDNAFMGSARSHFESMISEYILKLSNSKSAGKRQLISDKLVAIFFLLAKQYSDVKERMGTFQRLRAIMPHDVDRTTFDAVFHSHMALNWAIQGDSEIANKHEQIAKTACDMCSPCLATAAMSLNSQCKNNRLFYENGKRNYLDRAYTDFERSMQHCVTFSDEERRVWSTIATLEMSHSLLGINLYLEVCDIENILTGNIERARAIINRFKEPEEVRRKMFYKLAVARLHESKDPSLARAYLNEAIEMTDEGCYKEVEKINLQNYMDKLVAKYLPQPSL
jgi:hypothetical protein